MNKILNRRGFSLVEMLVAMAIFVMFTGILISSYLGIVKALRGEEENRILYSDARHVFDVLTEESRNSTIYSGGAATAGAAAGVAAECNLYGFDVGDSVEFCSNDGKSKVQFKYADEALYLSKYEKKEVEGLVKEDFIKINEEKLHSDEVKMTHFDFYVWPKENPYSLEGVPVVGMFQPKVTFVATFAKDDAGGGILEYNLQTSVSLRIYN